MTAVTSLAALVTFALAALWFTQPVVEFTLVYPGFEPILTPAVLALALGTAVTSITTKTSRTRRAVAGIVAAAGLIVGGLAVVESSPEVAVWAFDPQTGDRLWEAPGVGGLITVTDVVIGVDRDGHLVALDPGDGGRRWTTLERYVHEGVGAVVGGVVVVPRADLPVVDAVEVASGSVRWSAPFSFGTRPIVRGGLFVSADAYGRLAATDIDSGDRAWSRALDVVGLAPGPDDSVLVAAHGGGVVSVRSIDRGSGEDLWATEVFPCFEAGRRGPPNDPLCDAPVTLVATGNLVVAGPDPALIALDVHSGEQRWSTAFGPGELVLADGGLVAVGAADFGGRNPPGVIGVDAASGTELWRHTSDGFRSPTIAVTGDVIVSARWSERVVLSATNAVDGSTAWERDLTGIEVWPSPGPGIGAAEVMVLGGPNRLAVIDLGTGETVWKRRHEIPGRSRRFRQRGRFLDGIAGDGLVVAVAYPPAERDPGGA